MIEVRPLLYGFVADRLTLVTELVKLTAAAFCPAGRNIFGFLSEMISVEL